MNKSLEVVTSSEPKTLSFELWPHEVIFLQRMINQKEVTSTNASFFLDGLAALFVEAFACDNPEFYPSLKVEEEFYNIFKIASIDLKQADELALKEGSKKTKLSFVVSGSTFEFIGWMSSRFKLKKEMCIRHLLHFCYLCELAQRNTKRHAILFYVESKVKPEEYKAYLIEKIMELPIRRLH